MSDLTDRINGIVDGLIDGRFTDVTPAEYRFLKYPKLIPMMKFDIRCYKAAGFGHMMIMNTDSMGGAMKLMTISLVPCEGGDLPYLLIDSMAMKNKSLAYVEYYDCTGRDLEFETLNLVKERYAQLPDYAEKDAWYIAERMPASLIKGGEGADEAALAEMVKDSLNAYFALAETAEKHSDNIQGLSAFQGRMLRDGNPSSGTMEKVLGKEKYIDFYKRCIMPVE